MLSTEAKQKIFSISLSGQMHSLVILDSKYEVIRPSILWCDQRTSEQCKELTIKFGGEKEVLKSFGNPILTGFTAPKILWIKKKRTGFI